MITEIACVYISTTFLPKVNGGGGVEKVTKDFINIILSSNVCPLFLGLRKMPLEVWNPSIIFHQLSPRLALKYSPPDSTPWYLALKRCTATNVVQFGILQLAGSGGGGR